jgi:hypothetical protein
MSTVSSVQTIALDGLLNGQGLRPSSDMFANFNAFDALPVVVIINNMYAGTSNTVSNISGLYGSIASLPKWVTGRNANVKISDTVGTSANLILGTGLPGIKGFVSALDLSTGFCAQVLPWHAAVNKYDGKKFQDLGLQNRSYTDITTGGIAGYFSALKTDSRGFQAALSEFATAVGKFGTAYNFRDLTATFTPSGFIKNLQSQGIGTVSLSTNGYFYSDDELLDSLKSISGSALQKIITQTGIQTYQSGAAPAFGTLADFFDANKILPEGSRKLTPLGKMQDLQSLLENIGGSYQSSTDFARLIGSIQTTDTLDKLEELDAPLPDSVIASMSAKIGRATDGSLGTGPLGNPVVKDLMGIVGGINVTDNYATMINGHGLLSSSNALQNLISALQNVYTNDKSSTPVTVTSLNSAISAFNTAVQNYAAATAANTAINNVLGQLYRESTLRSLAGITLPDPFPQTTSTPIMSLAKNLPGYGVDQQQMGYGEIFRACADISTSTGAAILATLNEGTNQAATKNVRIPDNISSDATQQLKLVDG